MLSCTLQTFLDSVGNVLAVSENILETCNVSFPLSCRHLENGVSDLNSTCYPQALVIISNCRKTCRVTQPYIHYLRPNPPGDGKVCSISNPTAIIHWVAPLTCPSFHKLTFKTPFHLAEKVGPKSLLCSLQTFIFLCAKMCATNIRENPERL